MPKKQKRKNTDATKEEKNRPGIPPAEQQDRHGPAGTAARNGKTRRSQTPGRRQGSRKGRAPAGHSPARKPEGPVKPQEKPAASAQPQQEPVKAQKNEDAAKTQTRPQTAAPIPRIKQAFPGGTGARPQGQGRPQGAAPRGNAQNQERGQGRPQGERGRFQV